jgi:hypothetical protein
MRREATFDLPEFRFGITMPAVRTCRSIAPVVACAMLAILTTACGMTVPEPTSKESSTLPLNSERIKEEFGNYGVDVVRQDERLRVSSLYSVERGRKITRTVAVVVYPDAIPVGILEEHREILKGSSIGETFRRHGWSVSKKTLYTGSLHAAPDFDGVYAAMGNIAPTDLAVHVYELSVAKDDLRLSYAAIAEVHHPDYLRLPDLESIYGKAETAENSSIRQILDTVTQVLTAFRAAPSAPQSAVPKVVYRHTALDLPI